MVFANKNENKEAQAYLHVMDQTVSSKLFGQVLNSSSLESDSNYS